MTVAMRLLTVCLLSASTAAASEVVSSCWPGFVEQPEFAEQVREIRFSSEARAVIVAPDIGHFRTDRPTQLVIYATPNGNTNEQTLGCRATAGRDWHFDIQHAAAQVRHWRSTNTSENVVLACIQANVRSWPTWKQTYKASNQLIQQMLSVIAGQIPSTDSQIVLTGHSGGGGFITGYVDSVEKIPALIHRIAYLDANYSYSTEQQHGRKILEWLKASPQNHFLALAYDDREAELDGKKVVGPTGGTYRASHRMLDYLQGKTALEAEQRGEFDLVSGLNGRLRVLIHPNPDNKILHTRLVGEMNGLVYALAMGTDEAVAALQLGQPRQYTRWVQAAPFEPRDWLPAAPAIPPRQGNAPSGSDFVAKWANASLREREDAALTELLSGNVPAFLRSFCEIQFHAVDGAGAGHDVQVRVLPDYLALGADEDFLRFPLTPATAQCIADAYGCLLPTRKLVDAIYRQAEVKLSPQPLTEDREALSTFSQHQQIIDSQLQDIDAPRGTLISGIKKDVVISSELARRPGHVAIYGWHQPDGQPIQPLTTVHVAEYVDYSHGVRLVDQHLLVDGKSMRADEVLQDGSLHKLLSDEGPVTVPTYRPSVNP